MQYEIIDDVSAFRALEGHWQTLFEESERATRVFLDWHWVSGWWTHCAAGQSVRLRILLVTDEQGPLLIWPWILRRRLGLRILEPMGGLLSCYDDALVSPRCTSAILQQAWSNLLESTACDLIELRGVHQDAAIAGLLSPHHNDIVAQTSAPHVATSAYAAYSEYIASRPKKMRQNQRRSHKYLSTHGVLHGSGDDAELSVGQALDLCLRFKAQWLLANGLSGKEIMQPDARRFLQEVFTAYQSAQTGPKLAISSLYLDGTPISVGIGMRLDGQHFEYLAGFDHRYERHGPGRLRMAYGIEDCIAQGFERYDMLTPETSFKRIWTESRPAVRHYLIATSPAGRVYRELYVRRLRPALKQAYNRLPGPVRRLLH